MRPWGNDFPSLNFSVLGSKRPVTLTCSCCGGSCPDLGVGVGVAGDRPHPALPPGLVPEVPASFWGQGTMWRHLADVESDRGSKGRPKGLPTCSPPGKLTSVDTLMSVSTPATPGLQPPQPQAQDWAGATPDFSPHLPEPGQL